MRKLWTISTALSLLAALLPLSPVRSGAPLPTGDQSLHYKLMGVKDPLPYRLYVPADWRPGMHWPLVMVLHGFGGNADSPFRAGGDALRAEADRRHFLIVSPAGYDGKGDWGANLPLPGAPAARAMQRSPDQIRLAQRDAMTLFHRVASTYGVDRTRRFLIGNSMGMTGTLHLAAKYPGSWCGIGPSDGPPWPDYPVDRVKGLKGAFFIHGAADTIAAPQDSRAMAARFEAAGIPTRFMLIPGGDHGTAWVQAIPDLFAFFDGLSCG